QLAAGAADHGPLGAQPRRLQGLLERRPPAGDVADHRHYAPVRPGQRRDGRDGGAPPAAGPERPPGGPPRCRPRAAAPARPQPRAATAATPRVRHGDRPRRLQPPGTAVPLPHASPPSAVPAPGHRDPAAVRRVPCHVNSASDYTAHPPIVIRRSTYSVAPVSS